MAYKFRYTGYIRVSFLNNNFLDVASQTRADEMAKHVHAWSYHQTLYIGLDVRWVYFISIKMFNRAKITLRKGHSNFIVKGGFRGGGGALNARFFFD